MLVAVINNCGNIYSVDYALRRLGIEPVLTTDPKILSKADKIIFPGQGEASTTMQHLRESGLDQFILEWRKPFMGICIGMQLMCNHSEEGDADCLGIFDTKVTRFIPTSQREKVPHMGWNSIYNLQTEFLPANLENSYVYYVHSYYVALCKETVATTDYTLPFSAALQKENYYATQFHPEKSGSVGELILKKWLIEK
ncbi:MAG: imidazole glycerol phosphate synthase subunit HisH [Bacteroidales bacterium]